MTRQSFGQRSTSVTDTDNREFVLQDVIEEFYDLMIEKVLNYIGAE